MYNYHTDLVWLIDRALLCFLILLGIYIIIYAVIKEHFGGMRRRALVSIKKNLYKLALSGQTPSEKTCPLAVSDSTIQQFLDIEANRLREVLFFDEPEQKLFKDCFATPDKIAKIENIAKRSTNKWHRVEAIISLGYAQDVSAIGILEKILLDKDEDVSYFSMVALGQIKTASSAKILIGLLKKRPTARYKIASILENFPPATIYEVIELADDPDPSVRFWAMKLISKLKPESYIKKVEALTDDESGDVRAAACECLGSLEKRAAKVALLKCLKDRIWFVRMHAARALSKILGKECIPYVIDLIKDNSWYVIDTVKHIMAEHIETALPYIEESLYGEDEIAKRTSIESLEVSGYVKKLLYDSFSEDNDRSSRALRILEGMIKSDAHFGLERALSNLEEAPRNKFFEIIKNIDKAMGEHIEKKLNQQLDEL